MPDESDEAGEPAAAEEASGQRAPPDGADRDGSPGDAVTAERPDGEGPDGEGPALGEGLLEEGMGPGSSLAHLYRGEIHRMGFWRERLDQTTYWATLVMSGVLTWTFSSRDNPPLHHAARRGRGDGLSRHRGATVPRLRHVARPRPDPPAQRLRAGTGPLDRSR